MIHFNTEDYINSANRNASYIHNPQLHTRT